MIRFLADLTKETGHEVEAFIRGRAWGADQYAVSLYIGKKMEVRGGTPLNILAADAERAHTKKIGIDNFLAVVHTHPFHESSLSDQDIANSKRNRVPVCMVDLDNHMECYHPDTGRRCRRQIR